MNEFHNYHSTKIHKLIIWSLFIFSSPPLLHVWNRLNFVKITIFISWLSSPTQSSNYFFTVQMWCQCDEWTRFMQPRCWAVLTVIGCRGTTDNVIYWPGRFLCGSMGILVLLSRVSGVSIDWLAEGLDNSVCQCLGWSKPDIFIGVGATLHGTSASKFQSVSFIRV